LKAEIDQWVPELQHLEVIFFYYEKREMEGFGWVPVNTSGATFRKQRLTKEAEKRNKVQPQAKFL
jgi:hypothetical protein